MGKLCKIEKVVDCCEDCPHFQAGDDWEPFNVCGDRGKRFPVDFIPSDFIHNECELPDAEKEPNHADQR